LTLAGARWPAPERSSRRLGICSSRLSTATPVGTSVVVPRRPRCHTPILHSHLQHRPLSELACLFAIELLPRRMAVGDQWWRLGPAPRDFRLLNQGVAAARVEIDADDIASPEPRQPTARRALGRGVEDWSVCKLFQHCVGGKTRRLDNTQGGRLSDCRQWLTQKSKSPLIAKDLI
jgi:hypothetical protein